MTDDEMGPEGSSPILGKCAHCGHALIWVRGGALCTNENCDRRDSGDVIAQWAPGEPRLRGLFRCKA